MTKKEFVTPTACACGDHYFAPLTRGYVTMVSPEDQHLLRDKWGVAIRRGYVSVHRSFGGRRNRQSCTLSRVIMDAPESLMVDHANRNALDNRRENLRLCDYSQNSQNAKKRRDGQVPYKGVHFRCGKYEAAIKRHGRVKRLGRYETAEAAHEAYVAAARSVFGEFARVE